MRPAPLLALSFALLLAGCAPKLIPGTDIKDNSDTRAVLDLVGTYKNHLETKNVDGILKLVSKSFFENSGTPEGTDDYDLPGLEQKLRTWASKTKSVRASFEVKDIVAEGDKGLVRYFYDVSFQNPRARRRLPVEARDGHQGDAAQARRRRLEDQQRPLAARRPTCMPRRDPGSGPNPFSSREVAASDGRH
ncbi:MAG: hypothetical protein QM765_32735 [Myxococcales bacterium]